MSQIIAPRPELLISISAAVTVKHQDVRRVDVSTDCLADGLSLILDWTTTRAPTDSAALWGVVRGPAVDDQDIREPPVAEGGDDVGNSLVLVEGGNEHTDIAERRH